MNRRMIYLLLAAFAIAGGCKAQSAFQKAADAYGAQQYSVAIALYDSIEAHEGVSAQLYYNRGNAFYKLGQYAPAILNYERALLLNPGDEDTRANLELANSKITDKIEVADKFFITEWARTVRDWCSSNTWAVVGIVSFLLFIVGLYLYVFMSDIRLRKTGFFVGLPMLFISIVANLCAVGQNNRRNAHDEAIVFASSVTVKSTPADSGTDLFILHEGTKVILQEQVGQWIEIRLADGNRGWLPVSAIEII